MGHLIIGNKNYSSWSLRPWLLLKVKGIAFTETKIPLYIESSKEKLMSYSPSGKVPAFEHNSNTVWDSLAICEYVAELYPEAGCWPDNQADRSVARSISHEMHSGFFEIRNALPMNCRLSRPREELSEALQTDIQRVCDIWRGCRERFSAKGAFLFGEFSIADAMYAPVVLRFQSYGIDVGPVERAYMDLILSLPELGSWVAEAVLEEEVIEGFEVET